MAKCLIFSGGIVGLIAAGLWAWAGFAQARSATSTFAEGTRPDAGIQSKLALWLNSMAAFMTALAVLLTSAGSL